MHLGRFHRAIELLNKEAQTINPVSLIQGLINALSSVLANPGNAEIENGYRVFLNRCRKNLSESTLNNPRPILKMIFESIDAPDFIGDRLFSRLKLAIENNPANITLVIQELAAIQQKTNDFYRNVSAIDESFANLEVEYDDLDKGEAEIGLLIPRDEAASSLKDLSKEFNQWHNALAPIAELFDPEAGSLQVKLCATTDWTVYLASTPIVLYGIAKCVKGVNSILRELIESRSLIEKLIEKKKSPEAIEALENEHTVFANTSFRKLAEDLVNQHYKGGDTGRKNELKNGVGQSLTTLAQKITAGAQVEVRMLPPAAVQSTTGSESEGQEAPEIAEMRQLAEELDAEVDALSFDGETESIVGLLGQSLQDQDGQLD